MVSTTTQWPRLQYNIQSLTKPHKSEYKKLLMLEKESNMIFFSISITSASWVFWGNDFERTSYLEIIWRWEVRLSYKFDSLNSQDIFFFLKISVLILEWHLLCLTHKVTEIFIYILYMWSYTHTHTPFQIPSDLRWLINHYSIPGTGILSPI